MRSPGGLVTTHAENGDLIDSLVRKARANKQTAPLCIMLSLGLILLSPRPDFLTWPIQDDIPPILFTCQPSQLWIGCFGNFENQKSLLKPACSTCFWMPLFMIRKASKEQSGYESTSENQKINWPCGTGSIKILCKL